MRPAGLHPRARLPPDEADVVGPAEIVFRGSVGAIGRFRIGRRHPSFHDTGPIERHLLAFPRVPVGIAHVGGPPLVADPASAMTYNRGQQYRREALCEAGDRCEWFAYDAAVLADACAGWDPAAAQRLDRPFLGARTPVDAATYALQRGLFEYVVSGGDDALRIEETMLAVLARVHGRPAFARRRIAARTRTRRAHAEAAEEVRRVLATRFREPLSLANLAASVGLSPFHLVRVFRAHAGSPVHAHRTQLRLRAALACLSDATVDLTHLALELGFSSHAHFTTAFRAAFGVPPSAWRPSKNLEAR